MSIPATQPRYTFGIKSDVKNNVFYHDEQTLIYPAGTNLVAYNIDQRTQKFLAIGSGGETVTAMAISPNRRYAAVSEKKDEKAFITIFDLQNMRKRKTLSSPDLGSNECVSLAFSPDSKYLVCQGGSPGWTLVYWHWEKAKIMASTKITTPGHVVNVRQVSFNPQDSTQVCVIGDRLFKLFRYSDESLKQFAFTKVELQNYLCHAWISEDQLLLGTDSGKIQLFEVADLRNEFFLNPPVSERSSTVTSKLSTPSTSHKDTTMIHCILTYSKGFICSGGSGTLHMFEKTDNKDVYKKVRPVTILEEASGNVEHADGGLSSPPLDNNIMSMAISPSEEIVICSTVSQQLYSLALSTADMGRDRQFGFLSCSFHHGPITGMDVCVRKSIVSTCSLDKTVRMWNYTNNNLELSKRFEEEPYSISLHPSGMFVLVGFSEKLRLMNVLIDDIRTFKEFSIRGCKECSFSHGGHLFAAANSNLIQIFSTFTFENIANFKGHSGKVRGLAWSPDDFRLVSCGLDGAVYEWNIMASRREKECVLKSCGYTSLTLSPDMKTTYAVGSDQTLKEMNLAESQILRQLSAREVVLTQVILSRSGRMLFVGTSIGTVRAMRFPLTEPGEWTEHQAHAAPVTRMRLSCDDQSLFSVGEDGTLVCFTVTDKEGRMLKRDKDVTLAEEVLITRSELEEKDSALADTKTRVEELKMENEYQMRLKDMNYKEKTKELKETLSYEIETLKRKNESLATEMKRQAAEHEEDHLKLLDDHQRETQDKENTSNNKLMAEYEKYQELQARCQRLQEDYERQLLEMDASKKTALQEQSELADSRLQEKDIKLEEMERMMKDQQRDFDELQDQMEADTDQEILALKNRYERQIRLQADENLKLRGDTGILKKKVGTLQGEIDDLKANIDRLKQEIRKRDGIIDSLNGDIRGLKKEISERDETIQDKEKRIYDLKKKNQELEKFKFVLDYKIKELRRQMEPRENEIKRMKEQIRKMEAELGTYSRDNKDLLRQLEHMELKVHVTQRDIMKERQQAHYLKVEIGNFRASLQSTTALIQEPKQLKLAMKEMYKKYLKDYTHEQRAAKAAETDIHAEYSHQRTHMESTVASLRKKLAKDNDIHHGQRVRVMQENVTLLKEINDLRHELAILRTHSHNLEIALKLARKSKSDEQEILAKLKAPASPSGLGMMEPTDSSRLIEMQQAEIYKLRSELRELQEGARKPDLTAILPPLHPNPISVQ